VHQLLSDAVSSSMKFDLRQCVDTLTDRRSDRHCWETCQHLAGSRQCSGSSANRQRIVVTYSFCYT